MRNAIPLLVLATLGLATPPAGASQPQLDLIQLPPGFSISVFNDKVPGARSLALSPGGVLFVGTRDFGKVYAIKDGQVFTLAQGLNSPNGVAFHNGSLFVAEISRILRFDQIESRLANPPQPVVVNDSYPHDGGHGWKFIRFSPDGQWLYVPVGAPCNVCLKSDPRYASITRIRPDGTGFMIYASGIRNSVGFDFEPKTGELWFTSNGRDWMGDERPPDQLNHAPKPGMNFGFPYCHGKGVPDPDLKQKPCSAFTMPTVELPAHVAPLGMRFYTGQAFPPSYRGQIIVAEHGSWNRSKKIGYRLELVRLKNGASSGREVFASGWLQGEEPWGRPVDVEVTPEGNLLVSDDMAGAIYKITYRAN